MHRLTNGTLFKPSTNANNYKLYGKLLCRESQLVSGATLMILIVASSKDVASLNIAKWVMSHCDFREEKRHLHGEPVWTAGVGDKDVRLVVLNQELTHAQDIADPFPKPELIIFLSKHSSVSGTPTLSVHTPGNLSAAELGGIPRKVSVSPANAMRDVLKTMTRLKGETKIDYEVSYEATHHGPSLDVPTMFAELGSSPRQWSDLRASEVVAEAVIEAISRFENSAAKTVIGIGGPHYNGQFTRMALETDMAFGHMIPKYAISSLDSEILEQCVKRTLERVESAVLDWKGIKGEDKQPLVDMLVRNGIAYEKV
jgi:D-aminoacyl-tRNA deacylase